MTEVGTMQAKQVYEKQEELRPFTKADVRDLERVVAAIDRIEERHGDSFHGYEFDAVSNVRAAAWEALGEIDKLRTSEES
jgi:NAD(P)-dependent dehydrogenase (short-subunit alcohol dehydrogenase family)